MVDGRRAALVGVGLAVTPGLAGHAGTGIQTGLAIPADAIHVLAMACWLGGLVVLFAVGAARGPTPTSCAQVLAAVLRAGARARSSRWSSPAAFQAWRQVGSFDALETPTTGKLLIAKLVVFAALIVAAAFSREVVNRRFRDCRPTTTTTIDRRRRPRCSVPVPVAVGAGGRRRRVGPAVARLRRPGRRRTDGHVDDDDDDWDDDDDETRCDGSGARSRSRS